ncbi:hypothetical protein DFH28DRAFT_947623 [Melampsora americana]|nr:hypothetical protein DFH28DRAFT_947623 [Melampsora americana]
MCINSDLLYCLCRYSSGDLNATLLRYTSYDGPPHEHRGPRDYEGGKVKMMSRESASGSRLDEDDEDDEDANLDESEVISRRESPPNEDNKFGATSVLPGSTFAPNASLPSWSYLDPPMNVRASTSTAACDPTAVSSADNFHISSPASSHPSHPPLQCFSRSSESSPAPIPFMHYDSNTARSPDQQFSMQATMAINSGAHPSQGADAGSLASRRTLIMRSHTYGPGSIPGVTNGVQPRHPPYSPGMSAEGSWNMRHPGFSQNPTLAHQESTLNARDRSHSATGPGMDHLRSEPFTGSRSEDASGIAGSTADPSSSNPSYHRHHQDVERQSPGAMETASGEHPVRPRSRVSRQMPMRHAPYNPNHRDEASPIFVDNQPGSNDYLSHLSPFVSTIGALLEDYQLNHRAGGEGELNRQHNRQFTWPSTTSSGVQNQSHQQNVHWPGPSSDH